MTIEELNKLIREELDAYLEEDNLDEDDDVKVTTDEPGVETGEEALDLLRQIYDMIKPQVEDEGEVEDEQADDEDEPETADVEDSEEEEEGDPEPDEEDLEETLSIREAAGMPSGDELVALVLSMGIPAAMLAAAGGKPKLRALISSAGSNVKKRIAAVREFLAGIPDENSSKEVDENMDHPNYRADYTKDTTYNAEKVKGGLNESVERFKKLANIKG